MGKKVKTAENLAEMLDEYAAEVEEGEAHEDYGDLYIVDALCDMNEILYKDGVDEGRFYESFMLLTDKPVKLFETVEVTRSISGNEEKMKVMSILSARPSQDGKMIVELLGVKVREG